MSIRVIGLVVTIFGALGCAAAAAQSQPPVSTSCTTDAKFQEWVHSGAVLAATDNTPAGLEWRDSLRIAAVPASQVVLVTVDSLCHRAGRLMNQHEGRPIDEVRSVALVRLGSWYWGEDRGLRGGEFNFLYIMDSTLTTVLSVWGH